jgi:hypothetical protein
MTCLKKDTCFNQLTLAQLGVEPLVSKLLQYQTEMFFMFFFILSADQYIIDEHYAKLAQCRGLQLDLRVGVLTYVENNGTQGT